MRDDVVETWRAFGVVLAVIAGIVSVVGGIIGLGLLVYHLWGLTGAVVVGAALFIVVMWFWVFALVKAFE